MDAHVEFLECEFDPVPLWNCDLEDAERILARRKTDNLARGRVNDLLAFWLLKEKIDTFVSHFDLSV